MVPLICSILSAQEPPAIMLIPEEAEKRVLVPVRDMGGSRCDILIIQNLISFTKVQQVKDLKALAIREAIGKAADFPQRFFVQPGGVMDIRYELLPVHDFTS